MKIVVTSMIAFILLCLAVAAAAWQGYHWLPQWAKQPIQLSESLTVGFPPSTKLDSLAKQLEAKGLVENAILFQLWVKFFSDYSRFQAGSYRFEKHVSPELIASKMISGDTYVPVVFRYTIPEGFTVKQVVGLLIQNKVGGLDDFKNLIGSFDFRDSLGIKGPSLEGYLYPATYSFTSFPTPREALALPIRTFWKNLPSDYTAKVAEKGLTLEQAVIMASLIELETPHDDERSLVSEVIWRRLNKKIALAIDATIIYGIKDYKGNLTRKHLKDASNPYNSRIHQGLPPTPIGSPSRASLEAVLTPTDQGYMYYVLDLETGKHHFSKTLREHNRYVQKLIKDTRKANRR